MGAAGIGRDQALESGSEGCRRHFCARIVASLQSQAFLAERFRGRVAVEAGEPHRDERLRVPRIRLQLFAAVFDRRRQILFLGGKGGFRAFEETETRLLLLAAVLETKVGDERIHINDVRRIALDALDEHFGRVIVLAELHFLVADLEALLETSANRGRDFRNRLHRASFQNRKNGGAGKTRRSACRRVAGESSRFSVSVDQTFSIL